MQYLFVPWSFSSEYGLANCRKPGNRLMLCSIRDHYGIFRNSILTANARPEDEKTREALESYEYFDMLQKYDKHLSDLTKKIWENEYLNV